MDLFRFDAVQRRMISVDLKSTEIKIKDLIDGAYVLRIEDPRFPFYFAGFDEALLTYLCEIGKPYILTQSYITAIIVALQFKCNTHIESVDNSTVFDFVKLLEELYR